MTTRSVPDFRNQAQKDLWTVRRKHALLAGFPHDEAYEESYVNNLTSEEAIAKLAIAEMAYQAFQKKQTKKGKRATSTSEVVDTSEHEHGVNPASEDEHEHENENGSSDEPDNDTGTKKKDSGEPMKDKVPSEPPSEPSDSSSEAMMTIPAAVQARKTNGRSAERLHESRSTASQ